MSHRPFHPSELGVETDPLASADLVIMARELERLDGGPIRPTDGFADRVLAAIGSEPLPAPIAVAGRAAREGHFGAMVSALRDTWHVAWSGGRPLTVRAQAMAFVLLLIVAVGSVGAVTTVGAYNALFPTTTSPSPLLPVATPSPQPARTAEPTETPEPSKSTEPTGTTEPSGTPEPTETTKPGATPKPHETDKPSHTGKPGHLDEPEPTETPDPTEDAGSGDGGRGHGPGGSEEP